MTVAIEFPDYDLATLPAIPAGWTDRSWHNDACPMFEAPNGLVVFVDYAEDARREFPGEGRFQVQRLDEAGCFCGDSILTTDDWAEVLAVMTPA